MTGTQLVVSGTVTFFIYQWYQFYKIKSKIDHVPTLGSDNFILSFIDLWKFMLFNGNTTLQEGYRKFHGAAFKIRTPYTKSGWFIIVSSEKMLEDLRKAPSDVMSLSEASIDTLEADATLGHHAHVKEFQNQVIRTPLTRALNGRFSDLREEVVQACSQNLPNSDEWQELKGAHSIFLKIISQTSNRMFVGLPHCRNREYLQIQEDWTVQLFVGAMFLHMVPTFLKRLVGSMLPKIKSSMRKAERILGPTILERIEKDAKSGPEWEGRPADLISWLLDYAPPEHKNVEDISVKVMIVNSQAMHTTTLTLSNVLFHLAARPEYHAPLRAEMEEMIDTHGWTKQAMGHMSKLDSFIKEAMRHSGMANAGVPGRKVLKDFTFSNGIVVPAGYSVSLASSGIHFDPDNYEDPDTFKGFRFHEIANAASDSGKVGAEQLKSKVASLDPTWLMFGQGRNACPGRFFAINEVKAIVTHILLNHDLKLPGDVREPEPGFWFAGQRAPSHGASIIFRKRRS